MSGTFNKEGREGKLSLKAWLLKRIVQWGESILVNWFSGVSFLGALWVIQQLWGLRLIPFSVLDALIVTGGAIFLSFVIVIFLLYVVFQRYLSKHPGMALSLLIGLFATAFASAHANTLERLFKNSQETTQTATMTMNRDEEDKKV